MPEDTTPPPADAGSVDCHVQPSPADELQREIVSAWGRHAQRVHYSWPMGLGGHAALQSPQIMAEDGFALAARQLVIEERRRLLKLLEELRDANCSAQGVEFFQLLTPRQEKAWRALRAALS